MLAAAQPLLVHGCDDLYVPQQCDAEIVGV